LKKKFAKSVKHAKVKVAIFHATVFYPHIALKFCKFFYIVTFVYFCEIDYFTNVLTVKFEF